MAGELTSEQFIQIVNNLGSPDENMINKAVDQAIENKQLAPKSYVDMKIAEAIAKLQQGDTTPQGPDSQQPQSHSQPPSQQKPSKFMTLGNFEGADTGKHFRVLGDSIAMDLWNAGFGDELKRLGKVDAFIERGAQVDNLVDRGQSSLPSNAKVILMVGHDETGASKLSEILEMYSVTSRFNNLIIMPTPCVYSEERKDFVDLSALQSKFNGPTVSLSPVLLQNLLDETGMSILGPGMGIPSNWGSDTRRAFEAKCIPPKEPTVINADGTVKDAVLEAAIPEVIKVIK